MRPVVRNWLSIWMVYSMGGRGRKRPVTKEKKKLHHHQHGQKSLFRRGWADAKPLSGRKCEISAGSFGLWASDGLR